MAQLSSNRVLVLGRPRHALQDVMEQLTASGVSVQGSTDAQYAADLFDARDFDLISFGGAVSGSLNEQLRREFARRNPRVQFLDALAPIAAKQIVSALKGGSRQWHYLARSRVDRGRSGLPAESNHHQAVRGADRSLQVIRRAAAQRRGRRRIARSRRLLRAADRRSVPGTWTDAAADTE